MRIALATVGTAGDVRPFVHLGRRLAAAGHDVTVVTWPMHRAVFADAGLSVEIAGPHHDVDRVGEVAQDAARRSGMAQVAVLRDYHLEDGEAHYRRLRELLPGHDLVLIHGIHALAHAAVLDAGLRWASVVFDPVLLPTASAPPPGVPRLGPLNRAAWAYLDRSLARTARPLDGILQRAGSSQRRLPLFRARSPLLHMVACSPALIVVPPDLPASTVVTGAWEDPSPIPELAPDVAGFLAAGEAPIVMTFGSMVVVDPAGFDSTIRRVLSQGRRVIVQGETGIDSTDVLAVGPHDHRALFPHAALVVHHGGAGTTHTVCAAGIPSLVVPYIGDQRYWADRLRRLGVAPPPIPRERARAGTLADAAVATAAHEPFRVAARALAARMADEKGLDTAIAALEVAGA